MEYGCGKSAAVNTPVLRCRRQCRPGWLYCGSPCTANRFPPDGCGPRNGSRQKWLCFYPQRQIRSLQYPAGEYSHFRDMTFPVLPGRTHIQKEGIGRAAKCCDATVDVGLFERRKEFHSCTPMFFIETILPEGKASFCDNVTPNNNPEQIFLLRIGGYGLTFGWTRSDGGNPSLPRPRERGTEDWLPSWPR